MVNNLENVETAMIGSMMHNSPPSSINSLDIYSSFNDYLQGTGFSMSCCQMQAHITCKSVIATLTHTARHNKLHTSIIWLTQVNIGAAQYLNTLIF